MILDSPHLFSSLTACLPTLSLSLLLSLSHFDECFLGEFLIDLRPVGDVLGAVGVVQGAQRFFNVAKSRRDRGNDGGFGPTAQRVLQDASEFALSVTADTSPGTNQHRQKPKHT